MRGGGGEEEALSCSMTDGRVHSLFLVNFPADTGDGAGRPAPPAWHKQETLIKKNRRPLPRMRSVMFRFV